MNGLKWIERYRIRGERHEGWAVIHIDSKGFLGVASDFGNYAFHWSSFGEDFKEFLAQLHWDYLHGKLSPCGSVYDGDATERAIKSHILDRRRTKAWNAERAREEWDLLSEYAVYHHTSDGFSQWYRDTTIDEASEFHQTRPEPQCQAFCQKIWPRFVEALKAGNCEPIEPSEDLVKYRVGILKQLLLDWDEGEIDADVLLEQAFDRAISYMHGNPQALSEPD